MSVSLKDMVAAANEAVSRIDRAEAERLVAEENALIVDVRDAPEVESSGKVAGALHVSRGMLEFRADPASPYHLDAFSTDRPVIVYCASGGRSALAGKTLKDLGFERVHNLGGFKDWADAGGAVEHPIEPGM